MNVYVVVVDFVLVFVRQESVTSSQSVIRIVCMDMKMWANIPKQLLSVVLSISRSLSIFLIRARRDAHDIYLFRCGENVSHLLLLLQLCVVVGVTMRVEHVLV